MVKLAGVEGGLANLEFDNEVSFLVGENGSGKSTVLEAIAAAANLAYVGGEEGLETNWAGPVKLKWRINNHKGFFLRAEDFFGFIKRISKLKKELKEQKREASNRYQGYGQLLAVGSAENQLKQLESRYGELSVLSHGEGFLKLFMSRLVTGGLYLLDEPEAALSPKRQMALLSLIKEMVSKECQFIIATHSPILMAYPGADIFSFDSKPPTKIAYEEVEHVTLTKSFLDNPEAYFRRL